MTNRSSLSSTKLSNQRSVTSNDLTSHDNSTTPTLTNQQSASTKYVTFRHNRYWKRSMNAVLSFLPSFLTSPHRDRIEGRDTITRTAEGNAEGDSGLNTESTISKEKTVVHPCHEAISSNLRLEVENHPPEDTIIAYASNSALISSTSSLNSKYSNSFTRTLGNAKSQFNHMIYNREFEKESLIEDGQIYLEAQRNLLQSTSKATVCNSGPQNWHSQRSSARSESHSQVHPRKNSARTTGKFRINIKIFPNIQGHIRALDGGSRVCRVGPVIADKLTGECKEVGEGLCDVWKPADEGTRDKYKDKSHAHEISRDFRNGRCFNSEEHDTVKETCFSHTRPLNVCKESGFTCFSFDGSRDCHNDFCFSRENKRNWNKEMYTNYEYPRGRHKGTSNEPTHGGYKYEGVRRSDRCTVCKQPYTDHSDLVLISPGLFRTRRRKVRLKRQRSVSRSAYHRRNRTRFSPSSHCSAPCTQLLVSTSAHDHSGLSTEYESSTESIGDEILDEPNIRTERLPEALKMQLFKLLRKMTSEKTNPVIGNEVTKEGTMLNNESFNEIQRDKVVRNHVQSDDNNDQHSQERHDSLGKMLDQDKNMYTSIEIDKQKGNQRFENVIIKSEQNDGSINKGSCDGHHELKTSKQSIKSVDVDTSLENCKYVHDVSVHLMSETIYQGDMSQPGYVESVDNIDRRAESVNTIDTSVELLKTIDMSVESVNNIDVTVESVKNIDMGVESVKNIDMGVESVKNIDIGVESLKNIDMSVESVKNTDMCVESVTNIDMSMESVTNIDECVEVKNEDTLREQNESRSYRSTTKPVEVSAGDNQSLSVSSSGRCWGSGVTKTKEKDGSSLMRSNIFHKQQVKNERDVEWKLLSDLARERSSKTPGLAKHNARKRQSKSCQSSKTATLLKEMAKRYGIHPKRKLNSVTAAKSKQTTAVVVLEDTATEDVASKQQERDTSQAVDDVDTEGEMSFFSETGDIKQNAQFDNLETATSMENLATSTYSGTQASDTSYRTDVGHKFVDESLPINEETVKTNNSEEKTFGAATNIEDDDKNRMVKSLDGTAGRNSAVDDSLLQFVHRSDHGSHDLRVINDFNQINRSVKPRSYRVPGMSTLHTSPEARPVYLSELLSLLFPKETYKRSNSDENTSDDSPINSDSERAQGRVPRSCSLPRNWKLSGSSSRDITHRFDAVVENIKQNFYFIRLAAATTLILNMINSSTDQTKSLEVTNDIVMSKHQVEDEVRNDQVSITSTSNIYDNIDSKKVRHRSGRKGREDASNGVTCVHKVWSAPTTTSSKRGEKMRHDQQEKSDRWLNRRNKVVRGAGRSNDVIKDAIVGREVLVKCDGRERVCDDDDDSEEDVDADTEEIDYVDKVHDSSGDKEERVRTSNDRNDAKVSGKKPSVQGTKKEIAAGLSSYQLVEGALKLLHGRSMMPVFENVQTSLATLRNMSVPMGDRLLAYNKLYRPVEMSSVYLSEDMSLLGNEPAPRPHDVISGEDSRTKREPDRLLKSESFSRSVELDGQLITWATQRHERYQPQALVAANKSSFLPPEEVTFMDETESTEVKVRDEYSTDNETNLDIQTPIDLDIQTPIDLDIQTPIDVDIQTPMSVDSEETNDAVIEQKQVSTTKSTSSRIFHKKYSRSGRVRERKLLEEWVHKPGNEDVDTKIREGNGPSVCDVSTVFIKEAKKKRELEKRGKDFEEKYEELLGERLSNFVDKMEVKRCHVNEDRLEDGEIEEEVVSEVMEGKVEENKEEINVVEGDDDVFQITSHTRQPFTENLLQVLEGTVMESLSKILVTELDKFGGRNIPLKFNVPSSPLLYKVPEAQPIFIPCNTKDKVLSALGLTMSQDESAGPNEEMRSDRGERRQISPRYSKKNVVVKDIVAAVNPNVPDVQSAHDLMHTPSTSPQTLSHLHSVYQQSMEPSFLQQYSSPILSAYTSSLACFHNKIRLLQASTVKLDEESDNSEQVVWTAGPSNEVQGELVIVDDREQEMNKYSGQEHLLRWVGRSKVIEEKDSKEEFSKMGQEVKQTDSIDMKMDKDLAMEVSKIGQKVKEAGNKDMKMSVKDLTTESSKFLQKEISDLVMVPAMSDGEESGLKIEYTSLRSVSEKIMESIINLGKKNVPLKQPVRKQEFMKMPSTARPIFISRKLLDQALLFMGITNQEYFTQELKSCSSDTVCDDKAAVEVGGRQKDITKSIKVTKKDKSDDDDSMDEPKVLKKDMSGFVENYRELIFCCPTLPLPQNRRNRLRKVSTQSERVCHRCWGIHSTSQSRVYLCRQDFGGSSRIAAQRRSCSDVWSRGELDRSAQFFGSRKCYQKRMFKKKLTLKNILSECARSNEWRKTTKNLNEKEGKLGSHVHNKEVMEALCDPVRVDNLCKNLNTDFHCNKTTSNDDVIVPCGRYYSQYYVCPRLSTEFDFCVNGRLNNKSWYAHNCGHIYSQGDYISQTTTPFSIDLTCPFAQTAASGQNDSSAIMMASRNSVSVDGDLNSSFYMSQKRNEQNRLADGDLNSSFYMSQKTNERNRLPDGDLNSSFYMSQKTNERNRLPDGDLNSSFYMSQKTNERNRLADGDLNSSFYMSQKTNERNRLPDGDLNSSFYMSQKTNERNRLADGDLNSSFYMSQKTNERNRLPDGDLNSSFYMSQKTNERNRLPDELTGSEFRKRELKNFTRSSKILNENRQMLLESLSLCCLDCAFPQTVSSKANAQPWSRSAVGSKTKKRFSKCCSKLKISEKVINPESIGRLHCGLVSSSNCHSRCTSRVHPSLRHCCKNWRI